MFNSLDLRNLPAPKIVDELSFDAYKKRLISYIEEVDENYNLRESDSLMMLIEAYAYEALHKDVMLNEKIKKSLVTYANDADLDHLCLTNYGTVRFDNESDKDFLSRSLYSLEQSTTTGSKWAYLYFAKSAHEDVLDAVVFRKEQRIGDVSERFLGKKIEEIEALLYFFLASYATVYVVVYPFSTAIEESVKKKLFDEKIKPITDNLVVQGAKERTYTIEATIYFEKYIDREVFFEKILQKVDDLKTERVIGKDVPLSRIYDILHGEGVCEVELHSPQSKVVAKIDEVLILGSSNIRIEWSRDE